MISKEKKYGVSDRIVRILNPQYKTRFWRAIGLIVAVSVFMVSACITVEYVIQRMNDRTEYEYYKKWITAEVYAYRDYDSGLLYVRNASTGKKTLENIDWCCKSPMGLDSLAVFAQNGKRGYMDITTGEVAIPPVYSKAWIFSEGIAATLKNDSLQFIDHDGKVMFGFDFPYIYQTRGYDFCFHNGLCEMIDGNELWGLIDKRGHWVLKPEYSSVYLCHDKLVLYMVGKDNRYGIVKKDGSFLLPCEYLNVNVTENDGIFVVTADNSLQHVGYDGKFTDEELYSDIIQLTYVKLQGNSCAPDGTRIEEMEVAPLMGYVVFNGYRGLMDKYGNKITPPVFQEIRAINDNLYQCSYDAYYEQSVLMDAQGNLVSERE